MDVGKVDRWERLRGSGEWMEKFEELVTEKLLQADVWHFVFAVSHSCVLMKIKKIN